MLIAVRDGAGFVWTGEEAEGVERHLQSWRRSNQHAARLLHVTGSVDIPVEFELEPIEFLGNNAKANVGKICVNV